MATTNLPFEALLSPMRDVDVDLMDPEYRSYINYAGERIHHSCDRLMSGYESGFCDESELYFLTNARTDVRNYGYSYACKTHLRVLVFEFAVKLEEKALDHQFDEWEDKQRFAEMELEEQEKAAL